MSLIRFCLVLSCHKLRQGYDRFGFFRIAVSILFLIPRSAFSQVLHIELGAANYSPHVAREDSPKRFDVLKRTLQEITKKYGTEGIIYLNDIDSDGLKLALSFADEWAAENSYSQIKFIPLLGDYTQIPLPKVKSLHLTNPTWMQLPNWDQYSQRKETAKILERISSLSETGLVITTYFLKEMDFLKEEISSEFKLTNTRKNGYRYYFADGSDPGYKNPKIFILKSKEQQSCTSVFAHKK